MTTHASRTEAAGPRPGSWELVRAGAVPSSEGELHVWCASLDLPARRLRRLERRLAPDERNRLRRVRPAGVRRRLAASRGQLREILAPYLGVGPEAVRLETRPTGKPVLAGGRADGAGLHFNLSHSGDLLLVAVARGLPVGVDLEAVRSVPSAAALARRFFSERERASFETAPEPVRDRLFLTVWTRKEACVKALGDGFWAAARRFEVSATDGEPARVLSVDGGPAAHQWSLFHLAPREGYVGAAAVPGAPSRLRLLRMAEPDAARADAAGSERGEEEEPAEDPRGGKGPDG